MASIRRRNGKYQVQIRVGSYKRDEIATIARPEDPPQGGAWATGYARIESDLFIFMNIGVPGRTGHNFDNHYDENTGTAVWFGKPNSRSDSHFSKCC